MFDELTLSCSAVRGFIPPLAPKKALRLSAAPGRPTGALLGASVGTDGEAVAPPVEATSEVAAEEGALESGAEQVPVPSSSSALAADPAEEGAAPGIPPSPEVVIIEDPAGEELAGEVPVPKAPCTEAATTMAEVTVTPAPEVAAKVGAPALEAEVEMVVPAPRAEAEAVVPAPGGPLALIEGPSASVGESSRAIVRSGGDLNAWGGPSIRWASRGDPEEPLFVLDDVGEQEKWQEGLKTFTPPCRPRWGDCATLSPLPVRYCATLFFLSVLFPLNFF